MSCNYNDEAIIPLRFIYKGKDREESAEVGDILRKC